jgi:hypothetical protein
MATIPAPHPLLDLTCPHCHKMNLLAVVSAQGASSYSEHAVECAHCKKIWERLLPGPIVYAVPCAVRECAPMRTDTLTNSATVYWMAVPKSVSLRPLALIDCLQLTSSLRRQR